MKKSILSLTLLSTLLMSGCGTTGNNENLWARTSDLIGRAMSFVNEAEEWEAYSLEKTKQGVVYSTATEADLKVVSQRMDAEYAAAIDRLARPFVESEKMGTDLTNENQGYQFTYNHVMLVKTKSSGSTIGYCVNYDSDRYDRNGKLIAVSADKKIRKNFIYVAVDKPISASTASGDFTKVMCGESFYNKYKGS
ncbi:hypothetical protein VQ643_15480 [Pseudomonas sp. F1_0610]|uniref:hypothetical protein n=1 Tax=Pseudomonas sp. F1_0610 TaxID=3114284 RepID=UPI0039C425D3